MSYIEKYGWGFLLYRKRDRIIFKTKDRKDDIPLDSDNIFVIKIFGVGHISTKVLSTISQFSGASLIFKKNPKRLAIRISSYNTMLLRYMQIRSYITPKIRFSLAKRFVYSALMNKRSMLLFLEKITRFNFGSAVKELEKIILRLSQTEFSDSMSIEENVKSLMGIEGNGAHIYFQSISEIIPSEFDFRGRVKRPPTDPVNAALSYGYVFVAHKLKEMLLDFGFDTKIGFLHEFGRGRDSLSLDILEEFRQPVVDSVVFSMILDGALNPKYHFRKVGTAIHLNERGKNSVLTAIKLAFGKYRTHILNEIQKIIKCLLHDSKVEPFIWRV
ncbi:MAG: CRISPR-associated endonuclease Cas1 [Candidatus Odinarchaeota archaeon]|nr:CRISPR-associated endonuclease Cas1 [Candidatus Odinarchaeota archaeon]